MLVAGVVLKQTQKPEELATEEYVPLDLSFDAAAVQKIDISKPKAATAGAGKKEEEYVELVKKNDIWKVSGLFNARADEDKIEKFLKELREAKGELRAKDKALFPDFGIGDNEAYRIVLTGGANAGEAGRLPLLDLRIGTKKADYRSLFVRKEGSDPIYVTDANLFGEMGLYGDPKTESLNQDYWPSTSLVEVDSDKVTKLETRRFKDGEEVLTTSVIKEAFGARSSSSGEGPGTEGVQKKWKYTREDRPFAIDAEKIKNHLDSLKTWRAQKVLNPKEKDYGLAKPAWRMNILMEDGKEIAVSAGGADEDTKAYDMQVSGEPVVFQLTYYYFENMDVDDSRFFVDNPLGVDPDKTTKLVIRAHKKPMEFNPKQKPREALTQYLNDLKNFRVEKLLFEGAKIKSPAPYSLEVQTEGAQPQVLDFGEMVSQELKLYPGVKRGVLQPFAIAESDFKKYFDALDRLAEPKT